MAPATINPIKSSPVRDTYRFGDGPELVLKPGTMGWTASEMEDPILRRLWDAGRYEILDGVLTIMPAAFFIGGESAETLAYLLRCYLKDKKIPAAFSTKVDIQINETRLVRSDFVAVFGDDLAKFKALKFPPPHTDWRKHALTIPPTLVIESVSQGHENHDRLTKLKWYAEFGIPHYWIVDAFTKSLQCLLLKDKQYVDDGNGKGTHVVKPASLQGLNISLAEVWGDNSV
jgi:Uma2 family endonuclease